MISLDRILKDYRESGALNSLIPVQAAVGDGLFLTKSGDLVTWLTTTGIDSECLEPEEQDRIARRFESILRIFDERFRIHQYLVKRHELELPCGHWADAVVEEAVAGRLRYLTDKAEKLCRIESYLAIVYEGWRPEDRRTRLAQWFMDPAQTFRRALSERAAQIQLEQELAVAREFFTNKVTSFAIQLGDILHVERLQTQPAFKVFRQFLNYAPLKHNLHLRHSNFVDFQACDSALECHRDYLRLDDYFVQVLTLKGLPARTFADAGRGLRELPANYIVASEWKRESPQAVRSLIQSKRRHFFNSKASLLNFLHTSPNGAPRDLLIDDGAAAVVASLGGSLEEIEVQGRQFGQFSLTLILYHQDLPVLRRSVALAFKIFAALDTQLTDEHYNQLNAWLAVLPGNSAYNLRRQWLMNVNYADLSFLHAPSCGTDRNEHLNQESLAILESTGNGLYFLNLHVKDVAHTLVLGATGSGKSFLLNFIITHLQKCSPLTLIFDLGGSYDSLTQLFRGAYLRIGQPDRVLKMNPFALEPTTENLHFLFGFMRVLIESNGYRPTAEEERDLYEQIENLYMIAPQERRLRTLANILPKHLRGQLQKWVEGGPYAALFDHAEDELHVAHFQTFDFEGMDQTPDQLEALLFYVLHRATAAISEASLSQFKVLVIDEAWRFFRHPVIKGYITEALKTWRKKNAGVVLATQSSDDLMSSDMLSVALESCPTQLFLANPGMDRDAYARLFHLNATETERIAGLIPKKEFLLKQPGVSKVLQLNVGPKEYWIYTSNPAEVEKRRAAFERDGFREGLETLVRGNA